MSIENTEIESLDDILDETLDDLADLPENKPFPGGVHRVDLSIRRNAKKAGQFIVEMKHKEVIELANPNEEHLPKEGDKATVFIATKKKDGTPNEFGQGQLKLIMSPLAAMLGTKNIGEIVEGTKNGVECAVLVSIRKDKTGEYDDQQEIKKVEVM